MRNPAIKMAIWMLLFLAVIWLIGYLMGYQGEPAAGI